MWNVHGEMKRGQEKRDDLPCIYMAAHTSRQVPDMLLNRLIPLKICTIPMNGDIL